MNTLVSRFNAIFGADMAGPLAALALVLLVFGLSSPQFFTAATFGSVAFQLPELGILTLAMLIPILTGGLNLAITFTANIAGLTLAWYCMQMAALTRVPWPFCSVLSSLFAWVWRVVWSWVLSSLLRAPIRSSCRCR